MCTVHHVSLGSLWDTTHDNVSVGSRMQACADGCNDGYEFVNGEKVYKY